MNRPLLNKALAVGLLVAFSAVAFLLAFTFFRRGGYSDKESYLVHVYFRDATGITWKSRVQIAGITIGEVKTISLDGNRARLDLRIRNEIDLRKDACVSKRFPSALLPDALLDTAPGTPKAPSMKELPEAQREITCVREAVSIDALLDSMSKIATDVQVVSGELAQSVAGSRGSIKQIIENLQRVTGAIAETADTGTARIETILANTEDFTDVLREVAAADQARYHAIARNVEEASSRLVALLESAQRIVGEGEPGMQQSLTGVRESLEKLNRSMDQVEKVVTNIGEGKGVAGKLLADERLGEKLGNTLEGVSDYVDRMVRLKIEVNLRSEWLTQRNGSKSYAALRLLPRPDKFYQFELVSDPRGVDTYTDETIVTDQDGTRSTTVTSKTLNEKKLRFSAEYGRRYGPLSLRVGIIESSGGAGTDLHLLDDRLTMSVSVFNFDRAAGVKYPNLKIWADYRFLNFLYATVGTDDLMNRWRSGRYPGGRNFSFGRDVFVGGGVVFTDDDLKTLLGAGGSALSGASR